MLKKNKLLLYSLFFLLLMNEVKAQILIKGQVLQKSNSAIPLQGVVILHNKTNAATSTDSLGYFEIEIIDQYPIYLVAKMISFDSMQVTVNKPNDFITIQLNESNQLKEVNITSKRNSTEISTIKPINTELITEKELLKAACCNLSESFETNASIDVNYSDAVTGAKEIQLLGMAGIYTQFLTENVPSIRGLAVPFGLTYIPGPWMQSIQISKGTGSVTNGYESIAGQINIELLSPEKAKPFFVNAFADNDGRFELNTINNIKVTNKSNNIIFFNTSYNNRKNDHNNDGFLDQPRLKQLNLLNKFIYHSQKRFEAQIITSFFVEDRVGGQNNFTRLTDKSQVYGVIFDTKRFNLTTKTGYLFPSKPWKSFGWQNSFVYHDLNSSIGIRKYIAKQKSFYSNLAYQSILNTTDNKFKAGIDYKLDDLQENAFNNDYATNEYVPGAFIEISKATEDGFGYVIGNRIDYHNLFDVIYTPKVSIKYNFNCETVLRASFGKGNRTPRLFADNLGLMVSSKEWEIQSQLKLEEGWNTGVNFSKKIQVNQRELIFTIDLYYSWFQNQLVVDQYSNSQKVIFYNLEGTSYSRSLQTQVSYEILPNLDVKIAYKNDDVRLDYQSLKNARKPLVSSERALLNLAYTSPKELWRFDFTLQYDGYKLLSPTSFSNEEILSKSQIKSSTPFIQLLGQITRTFKKWEAYIGGENLLDYTQSNPIVNSSNPFSNTFDATNVWGPIMDRKIYMGIRINFN